MNSVSYNLTLYIEKLSQYKNVTMWEARNRKVIFTCINFDCNSTLTMSSITWERVLASCTSWVVTPVPISASLFTLNVKLDFFLLYLLRSCTLLKSGWLKLIPVNSDFVLDSFLSCFLLPLSMSPSVSVGPVALSVTALARQHPTLWFQ